MQANPPKRRFLTDHGIQLLDEFLAKHSFYYDIRIEITDHYASALEQLINENKTIEFDHALRQVHKSLGGDKALRKIVKSKEKSIRKYWNHRVRQFMLGYLTWPKMLLACLLFTFFFLTFTLFEQDRTTLIVTFGVEVIVMIAAIYIQFRSTKTKAWTFDKQGLYSYLCFGQAAGMATMAFLPINIQQVILNYAKEANWAVPVFIGIAVVSCTYYSLKAHAYHTHFRYWIKDELESKYPEYANLVKF